MPAMPADLLKTSLEAAFLALGPEKCAKRDESGAVVPGQLPDQVKDVIEAVSNGVAAAWVVWQSSQTVVGTATGVTSGPAIAPVLGALP
jgi:hypothetical protein